MSRNPNLPISPHPPDTYEGRMHHQLKRELHENAQAVGRLQDGKLAGVQRSPTVPTGGDFAPGDIVRNSLPFEGGSAGSKYVIFGWMCIQKTPLVFLECRFLTGN